jgi:chaperonin GroES
MGFKFVTTNDKVVVELIEGNKTSAGGLVLVSDDADEPNKATVVAVGPGKRNSTGDVNPLIVTAGNTVLFKKGLGEKVKIQGTEYVILKEDDLFAILED